MKTVTGNTRLRAERRLFRSPLLVLQVEEKVEYGPRYDPIDRDTEPGGHYFQWRDARVEDMTQGAGNARR